MRACFLDRDGVINFDKGYIRKKEDITLIGGAIDGLNSFIDAGFQLFIVTNQSGVSRGLFSLDTAININNHLITLLRNRGIQIAAAVICPHNHGPVDSCNCRKPKPLMLTYLEIFYDIEMKDSLLIGDKKSDVLAGVFAGVGSQYQIKKNKTGELNRVFNHHMEKIR